MVEPGAYNADYADTFAIKLSGFAYISREEQVEILRHYRDYLLFSQKHVLAARQRVVSVPVIRDFERVHYLRMLDHKLLLLAADLAWVDAQIAGDDTASSRLARREERTILHPTKASNQMAEAYRIPVPAFVRLANRLTKLMVRANINVGPMGQTWLLTVPGRKSGLPRTTPVTMVERQGKALPVRPLWRGGLGAQPARGGRRDAPARAPHQVLHRG